MVLVAFELLESLDCRLYLYKLFRICVSVRTYMWIGPRVHMYVRRWAGWLEGGRVSGLVDCRPCCVCRCFETFDAVTVTSKEDRMSLLKVMESCKTQQEKGVLVLV